MRSWVRIIRQRNPKSPPVFRHPSPVFPLMLPPVSLDFSLWGFLLPEEIRGQGMMEPHTQLPKGTRPPRPLNAKFCTKEGRRPGGDGDKLPIRCFLQPLEQHLVIVPIGITRIYAANRHTRLVMPMTLMISIQNAAERWGKPQSVPKAQREWITVMVELLPLS